jgi:hypothetical protein
MALQPPAQKPAAVRQLDSASRANGWNPDSGPPRDAETAG